MASENETVAAAIITVRKMIHECPVITGGLGKLRYQLKANCAIDRIEAAHKREVAELRECLKEAIREKCPFTRMSCKYGEPCDYECGTVKWRKAIQDEGGAK